MAADQPVTSADDPRLVIKAEVPHDKEGSRLPRRGNRWYPTLVDFYPDGSDHYLILFPEEARALAAALVKSADKADEIDKPDTDECGHWWPCGCGRAA